MDLATLQEQFGKGGLGIKEKKLGWDADGGAFFDMGTSNRNIFNS